jgi:hypothetical protein
MGKKDQIARLDQAERRNKAIEMRRVGIPWEKIADEVGYSSPAAAAADIYKVLSDRTREMGDAVAGLRSIEADKLDAMERVVIQIMRKPHILAQQGRVVIDPTTGMPAEDPGPLFQCIDRLLRIAERRAKLLGIDTPVKAQVEIKATGIDAEIAGLLAGMVTGGESQIAGNPEIREVEGNGDS